MTPLHRLRCSGLLFGELFHLVGFCSFSNLLFNVKRNCEEKLSFRLCWERRELGKDRAGRKLDYVIFLNNQGLGDIWLFHFGSFLSGDSRRVRDDCAFYRGRGNVALAHGEDMINVLLMTVLAVQQPLPTHGRLSTSLPRE